MKDERFREIRQHVSDGIPNCHIINECVNELIDRQCEIESLQAELTDAKQLEAELRDVRNTLKENLIISLATQRKVKTVHPTYNDGYRRGLTEAVMELELAFDIGTPATVGTVRERKRGL